MLGSMSRSEACYRRQAENAAQREIRCVRPADTVPLREPSGRSEASREQPSGIFTEARRPDFLGVTRRSEITVAQVTR